MNDQLLGSNNVIIGGSPRDKTTPVSTQNVIKKGSRSTHKKFGVVLGLGFLTRLA